MNISLDKIAPSVALVIVGLILVVIGAIGVVPIGNPFPIVKEPYPIALFILGILFLIIGVIIIFLDFRKQSVSVQSRVARNSIGFFGRKKSKAPQEQGLFIDPKLVHFTPPLNPNEFCIVNIPRPNPVKSFYAYKFAPTGIFVTHNVPFFLLPVEDNSGNLMGHLTVQVQPGPHNIVATTEKFEAKFDNICKAHFLISAGHGWRLRDSIQLLHKRIGYVRFEFSDGTNQTDNLVIGKHLREWSFGNNPNLITEIDLDWVKPVWLSHDGTKRFDLLTIPFQNSPKNIEYIEIGAKFDEDPNGKIKDPPTIIISGITLERKIK